MPRKKGDSVAADGADSISTLAVDRVLADQIRATAKKYKTTTLEITNQLIGYALSQGHVEVEVKKIIIQPAPRRR